MEIDPFPCDSLEGSGLGPMCMEAGSSRCSLRHPQSMAALLQRPPRIAAPRGERGARVWSLHSTGWNLVMSLFLAAAVSAPGKCHLESDNCPAKHRPSLPMEGCETGHLGRISYLCYNTTKKMMSPK